MTYSNITGKIETTQEVTGSVKTTLPFGSFPEPIPVPVPGPPGPEGPEGPQGPPGSGVEEMTAELNAVKAELAANKSDLDRTNLYVDALFKLNRGQTWDTIESENESYSVDVPSGAKH